jgi:hypothetical protein
VISKIRNEFNIELPLKTLFEKPGLVNLSEIIENTKSESEIAKIPVSSRDTDLPLSFAQERLWFIDQYEHNASYNMPGAVKLIGKLDINVLEKTFSEIIRRHEVLRTNIDSINKSNVLKKLNLEKGKFPRTFDNYILDRWNIKNKVIEISFEEIPDYDPDIRKKIIKKANNNNTGIYKPPIIQSGETYIKEEVFDLKSETDFPTL